MPIKKKTRSTVTDKSSDALSIDDVTNLSLLGEMRWEYDPEDEVFLSVSIPEETYLGYTKEEWLNASMWPDLVHPSDQGRLTAKREKALKENKRIDSEYRFRNSNGEFSWIRELSYVSINEDGTARVKGYFFDVTDYLSIRALVAERESPYRNLVDAMPDPFLIQQNGVIVFANPAAEFLLGDGREESLFGVKVEKIFTDRHHAQARINTVTSGGQSLCTSNEIVHSIKGKSFDAEIVSCMTMWGSGPAVQSVIRDLTWLSEMLNMLREEKNLSKLVLDHIIEGVCVVDEAGIIKSVNPSAAKILGISASNAKGQSIHGILHLHTESGSQDDIGNSDAECIYCKQNRLGKNYQLEKAYLPDNDTTGRFLRCESTPIFNNKQLFGAVITIRDLTQIRQRDTEIHNLTRAIEQSPVALAVTDIDGAMEYVNPEFCDLIGISFSDYQGKFSPLLTPETLTDKTFRSMWRTLKAGKKWEGEIPNFLSDGRRIWIRGIVSPLKDENGNVTRFLGMYVDVTNEQYARALQKATESKLTMIFNSIGNAIFMISDDGKIEAVNPACIEMFGYENEVLDRINITDILPEFSLEIYKETSLNGASASSTKETYGINKEGIHIPVLLTVGRMPQPSWQLEDRRTRDRKSYICTIQDISAQKEAQNAIENAQKMEALGQLTGGLAHDFNNILGIVIGNLDLVKEDLPDDSPLVNYVSTALRASLRGADLSRSLLDFSRSAPINTEMVDANEIVDELQIMLQPALTTRIIMTKQTTSDLWYASLNKSEFISALMNLILNARDAMPSGGNISIMTANLCITEPKPLELGICPPGDYICITVKDTGSGMDQSTLDKMFEPFYTTKPKGKGTGLGLSTVFGFIHRTGGFIDVSSEIDKGTSISLIIPRAEEEHPKIEELETIEVSSSVKSGELLVVDDEAELAEFCRFTLEREGYSVHMALNGRQALDALQNHPNISTMISDVVMPGDLDGIDLCAEVGRRHQAVKVILTTGFTEKITGRESLPENCMDLLRKPFRAAELTKMVANVEARQK